MIFAYTFEQVLEATKTQTRRLIKPDEHLHTDEPTRVEVPGKRIVYQVGKSYAVQPGRGQKSLARIQLKGIRRETPESISDRDAIAEGFSSREEFLETWKAIHGSTTNLEDEVWVLEFELEAIVIDDSELPYEDILLAKNRSPHNSDDLPASITRVSGVGMHRWHH